MIKFLLKKKYLRRISGIKHEKFENCVSKLKPRLESGAEAEASSWSSVWSYGIAGTFAAGVNRIPEKVGDNKFVMSHK